MYQQNEREMFPVSEIIAGNEVSIVQLSVMKLG